MEPLPVASGQWFVQLEVGWLVLEFEGRGGTGGAGVGFHEWWGSSRVR
jgi:hypothetical protein